jgi:hypothetical protein
MRGILLSLSFAFLLAAAGPARATGAAALPDGQTASITAAAPVYALQIPDKKVEITVGERGAGVAWYRNPVWIAIGVLALIVLLLLVIVAVRGGGGTTVVKD